MGCTPSPQPPDFSTAVGDSSLRGNSIPPQMDPTEDHAAALRAIRSEGESMPPGTHINSWGQESMDKFSASPSSMGQF